MNPRPDSLPNLRAKGLKIAIAKGRLTEQTFGWLAQADLPVPIGDPGRKLIVDSTDERVQYVMAKPADVPTYVEYGAAELGFCGLDALREGGRDVYEPLLLPFGQCRLSLAGPAGWSDTPLRYESQPRVATSFPNLTAEFFRSRGVNAEVIALRGSVELGPLVGLADLIVDLVQTGDTLRANGLIELRVIMHSQAVLIANRAAYRLKSEKIHTVIDALRAAGDKNECREPK